MEQDERIGESERWASALMGGMLLLSSVRRRDIGSGALFAMGGAALLYRGLAGRGGFFHAIGELVQDAVSVGRPYYDEVDEASMESFPASDAPSFTQVSAVRTDEAD